MERPRSPSPVLVALGAGCLLRGVDLQHSDLAVQRTLVEVRRHPHGFPGDLVADHALFHPGIWLDALATLPDQPQVLIALGLGLAGASVTLAAVLLRVLGGTWANMGFAGLFLLMHRELPGMVELFPSAPTSRAAAIPLILGGFCCVASARPFWAGFCAGMAAAVHPAVGAGTAGLILVWSRQFGPTSAGVVVGGLPMAIGLAGLFEPGWRPHDMDEWSAIVRARWDHHLSGLEPSSVLLAVLAASAAAWLAHRGDSLHLRRAGRMALLIMMISGLAAVAVSNGVLPMSVARLHPWHWWVAPVLFSGLLLPLQIQTSTVRWVMMLALMVAGVKFPIIQWQRSAAPLPAGLTDHLSSTPVNQPLLTSVGDAPFVRLQAERAVVVTIKDGAEVIGSPAFAVRWAERMHDLCGLSGPPAGPGPGWTRYRRSCAVVGSDAHWAAWVVRYQPAAVCLPEGVHLVGWTAVGACVGGRWMVRSSADSPSSHGVD